MRPSFLLRIIPSSTTSANRNGQIALMQQQQVERHEVEDHRRRWYLHFDHRHRRAYRQSVSVPDDPLHTFTTRPERASAFDGCIGWTLLIFGLVVRPTTASKASKRTIFRTCCFFRLGIRRSSCRSIGWVS